VQRKNFQILIKSSVRMDLINLEESFQDDNNIWIKAIEKQFKGLVIATENLCIEMVTEISEL